MNLLFFLNATWNTRVRASTASDVQLLDGIGQRSDTSPPTKNYSSVPAKFFQRTACVLLTTLIAGIVSSAVADEPPAPYHSSGEQPSRPRTFDKQITDKLGVNNVAYLLAVDVYGKAVSFIPNNPKASFRIIDPTLDKLTMDLFNIEPFTVIAGKRNPFCVIFVGDSGRKSWMESCP